MTASRTTWQGALARIASLAILTVALSIALALPAHAVSAASTSCGANQSACGPQVCHNITASDLSQPGIARMGNASAQLSRAGGFNASTVSVSGSGWPAGWNVTVSLATYSGSAMFIDRTTYAQGIADASGELHIAAFSPPHVFGCMTADLSQYAPDQVVLILQSGAQTRVPLLYTIYPNPLFQSSADQVISAGAPVMLTGQGWDTGQSVIITPAIQSWPSAGYPSSEPVAFTPLTSQATTLTPQPDGAFSIVVHTPVEEPETLITYFASASYALYGSFTIQLSTVFSVLPTTTPTLALSDATGLAGSSVTLTGADWPANQDITITYCRGQQLSYCDPTVSENLAVGHTDSAGHLKATVQIPADAQPGKITIQAYPVTSPFIFLTYAQALPFTILYPFDQAHPRLALAIRVAPYVAAGLVIALLLLAGWLLYRRRAARGRVAPDGV